MATTNRTYILVAFLISGIAAVFNIASLATEQWVYGETAFWDSAGGSNTVHFGLFQGNYVRMPFSTNYQLTMTCSFQHNVCALLCGPSRTSMLDNLYNNIIDPDYAYADCPTVLRTTSFFRSFEDTHIRASSDATVAKSDFMNAGVWLCTLIFLILAALIGLFASVLAMYNAVTNPIQYFLSVRSLFYYNAAAFCSTFMYIVLWGAMYHITIFHNVGIYDTLVNNISSDKRAFLGYSYWISFIPLALYPASIVVLYYREYLNAKDPQTKVTLDVDSADPNLYLY